jgi:hypothetical protein
VAADHQETIAAMIARMVPPAARSALLVAGSGWPRYRSVDRQFGPRLPVRAWSGVQAQVARQLFVPSPRDEGWGRVSLLSPPPRPGPGCGNHPPLPRAPGPAAVAR